MIRKSQLPFHHRVDIYEQVRIEQASGQKKPYWVLVKAAQPCHFVADRTETRVSPTMEDNDKTHIFFPTDAPIDYHVRLKNVTNRWGDKWMDGETLEVTTIKKFNSLRGRPLQVHTKCEKVIEDDSAVYEV